MYFDDEKIMINNDMIHYNNDMNVNMTCRYTRYISWYPCLPRPLPRPRASLQSVASRYTAEEAAMMPPHRHCNKVIQRLQHRYIDHSSSPLELETKVRNHGDGPY